MKLFNRTAEKRGSFLKDLTASGFFLLLFCPRKKRDGKVVIVPQRNQSVKIKFILHLLCICAIDSQPAAGAIEFRSVWFLFTESCDWFFFHISLSGSLDGKQQNMMWWCTPVETTIGHSYVRVPGQKNSHYVSLKSFIMFLDSLYLLLVNLEQLLNLCSLKTTYSYVLKSS